MTMRPKNASRVRLRVTLAGKGLEFVKSCLEKGYIEKAEDFFDRAGSFLEWGIKTIESGEQVAAFNKETVSVTVFDVVIKPIVRPPPKVEEKKPPPMKLVIDNTKKE